MPVLEASQSMTKYLVKFGSANTRVEHMACLRATNTYCATLVHRNEFLLQMLVRGLAM